MSVLSRPDLKVEVAFQNSPFTSLDDPSLVWTDISSYVELAGGISIQRRRATELDEPSPGTLSLSLDNSQGHFTRLNTGSPFYPNVKANRLIRVRAFWDPATSVNLLTKRQATGGQADPSTTGFYVPSGTKTSPTGTVVANAAGTTTTLKCADADAADLEIGDIVSISTTGVSDSFGRSVSNNWGTSDSGPAWTTSGGPASAFSVTGTVGRVALGTVALRHYTTAGSFTDVDVSAAITVPVTASAQSISAGVVTRYYDDSNFYLFQLLHDTTGNIDLQINRCVGGNFTTLGQALNVITYTPGTATNVRVQCTGDDLMVRVWTGATEPVTWNLTATDATYSSGKVGTHSNLVTGNTNTLPVNIDYDGFFAAALTSATASTIYRQLTNKSSAAGTTTFTFSPAASAATSAGDVMTGYRVQWDTGNQQTTGSRIVTGSASPDTCGPDPILVTAGLSYTWSFYAKRGSNSISVSPRILWYDSAGAPLSESTGSTSALTTSLTRYTQTATAPANAKFARCAVANETIFNPAANVAFRESRTGGTLSSSTPLTVTIPASTQAGDCLLVWVNLDDENATITTPSGWTAVGNKQGISSRSYLIRKVASSTDAGKKLTVAYANNIKDTIIIATAYSGTDTTNPVHQSNSAVESNYQTTHVTPNVTTTVANCWIISACFDRSTTTSNYTQPGGDTRRAQVFCTGSNAATGAVSDNAAAVAAGTYGTKTWTANHESDDATMWTVAIKPGTTSGPSTGTIIITGLQFEQAASASSWAIPAGIYTRFVGHVDSWPTAWEGGFRALTTITATDRMKLLNDQKVKDAITQQIGTTGPVILNPLNEESGATAAANTSGINQPSIPIVSRGTVTDDMLEWGGGTGPGVDAQSALKLTPASTTNGKALRGTLTTPLGGDGVTGITLAICFNSTVVTAGQRNAIGVDDGKTSDGGVINLLDMYFNPDLPRLRAHFAIDTTGIDVNAESATQWHDGHTHMAVATVSLSGGSYTLRLYVDGALKDTETGSISITELPRLSRWSIGCSVADDIQSIYSGVLSYAIGWNTELDATQISDLWDATSDGFTGDLPGARAQRIADWVGLTTTNFETGVEQLGSHPSAESSVLDAYRLIARSEGGVFLVSRDGYSTLQARSHRTNAVSQFTVSADQFEKEMAWTEDPALITNEITVKYGGDEVHSSDPASQEDYGVQDPGDIDTILATSEQALDRGDSYLARYSQPISRPDSVSIEALVQPELFTALLNAEIGTLFTVGSLPTGAPASTADLFVEGVGEDISHESWKFSLDCSPESFDFGLILDDNARGLLDSNYLGW